MKHLHLLLIIAVFVIKLGAEQNSSNAVLLVYENTRFKRNLITEMEKILSQNEVNVTVTTHSKNDVAIENPSQYGAIFISNSGVNSQVRPWITAWLEQTDFRNILLHTTQTRDWQVETEFDAVTSASSNSEAAKLAQDYSQKLLLFLSSSEEESGTPDHDQTTENENDEETE